MVIHKYVIELGSLSYGWTCVILASRMGESAQTKTHPENTNLPDAKFELCEAI